MSKIATNYLLILTMLALTVATQVSGLESDRDESVAFSADGDATMRIVDGTRILEMSNNVRVTQGSLEIFGNEAIFEYDATTNELRRVTVHGTPVSYRQQLDEEGRLVTGSSDTILFYSDENTGETIIELVGNAEIQDRETSWRCVAITYIVERELIPKSTGPCEGSLGGATQ